MKPTFTTLLSVLCACAFLSGCAARKSDSVYQVSTIPALMQGVYDGTATWGECAKHGNTGLGTFNGLDGEMVVIDGRCYKVKHSGTVERMPDSAKTPFLTVTFFEPDESVTLSPQTDMTQLKDLLDNAAASKNYPWCVRIDGVFAHIKTRSVEKQRRPYPPLTQAVKNQSFFTFKNISGSIVGFRFPEYAKGLNVPGWHLHFISDDRSCGGHLVEVTTGNSPLSAQLDLCTGINTLLPDTPDFALCNTADTTHSALQKVEAP